MLSRQTHAATSATQTNAAFIAAPPTATQWTIIDRIYVSADAEVDVSLVNSAAHTLVWFQYCGAKGGSVSEGAWRSAVGEGFDLTTDGAVGIFVKVDYHYSGD